MAYDGLWWLMMGYPPVSNDAGWKIDELNDCLPFGKRLHNELEEH